MKTTELRIGNILRYRDGEEVTVMGLGLTYIIMQKWINGTAQDFDERISEAFSPIELTEEWLIRFGFEKDYDGCPTLLILKNRFQYSHNTKELLWQQTPHNDWSGFPCSYVHTFQNIFYALTGQELTLAPPQR